MLKSASLVLEDVGRMPLSFMGSRARPRKSPVIIRITENEGLEPPSLTAAVFKTADLPISLVLLAKENIQNYRTVLILVC